MDTYGYRLMDQEPPPYSLHVEPSPHDPHEGDDAYWAAYQFHARVEPDPEPAPPRSAPAPGPAVAPAKRRQPAPTWQKWLAGAGATILVLWLLAAVGVAMIWSSILQNKAEFDREWAHYRQPPAVQVGR